MEAGRKLGKPRKTNRPGVESGPVVFIDIKIRTPGTGLGAAGREGTNTCIETIHFSFSYEDYDRPKLSSHFLQVGQV